MNKKNRLRERAGFARMRYRRSSTGDGVSQCVREKRLVRRQVDYFENISMLEEARDLILEAVGLIRDAIRGTRGGVAARAESYIIPHLESWAGDEGQAGSIPDLIADLERLVEED